MKKYLLILIVLLLNVTNVNAVTSDKIPQTLGFGSNNIWNMDYLDAYVDGTDYNIAFVTYKPNDKVAFCIEPSVMMYPDKEYRIESYTDANLRSLAEIYLAFEALGKPRDLYVTAQLLIWERLGIHHTVDGKSAYDLGADKILNKIQEIKPTIRPNLDVCSEYPFDKLIKVKDFNGLIANDYDVADYSEGLSDVHIEGDELCFRITGVLPVNKFIKLEPKDDLKSKDNLVAGEIYLASGSQSLFSYSSKLPKTYEGVEINFSHETGDLIINKTDEWGNEIKNGVTFKIKRTDEGYEDLVLNNPYNQFCIENAKLKVIDLLPPGNYQISEVEMPYQYTKPITFDTTIYPNTLTEYNLKNLNRDISFNVYKMQSNADYMLNNTKFSLYDITKPLDNSNRKITMLEKLGEDSDDYVSIPESVSYPVSTIVLVKQNHLVDLNQILNIKSDLNLLINEHGEAKIVKTANNFDENHLYHGFALNKTLHKITDDIVDVRLNYGDEYIPLDHIEIDGKLINNLELISSYENIVGQHLMVYQFKLNNKEMILLQPIGFEYEDKLEVLQIYEVDKNYRLGIVNDDSEVIKEDAKLLEGIKIQEQLSGIGSIQVVHPYKHNYYIPNAMITLYNDYDELIGDFKANELGYIDVSEIPAGNYYYMIEGEKVEVYLIKNPGNVRLQNLKQDRNYLLFEDLPTIGYEYGKYNPVTLIDGHLREYQYLPSINLDNEMASFNFQLFKTNHAKSLLLNGAEFDVYFNEVELNRNKIIEEVRADDQNGDKILYGHFVTGCLNINHEFDELIKEDSNTEWVYEIYRYSEPKMHHYFLDEELLIGMEFIKELPYTSNANIEGLNDGDYRVKLRKKDSKEYLEKAIDYKVITGGIDLHNIPYNQGLEIIETKAPMGYYSTAEPLLVESDLLKTEHNLYNYRINEMIIINTSVNE